MENSKDFSKDATEELQEAGWKAIEEKFLSIYPGQENRLHYGTLISWQLGGPDPLDGISVFDGGEYYHFVTFGFSELYEKESKDQEYSGYGFELTVKLKKSALEDPQQEIRCMCGILQAIAKLTFEKGEIFMPGEYLYTGQSLGMDANQKSNITGFITCLDEAGEMDTPNGKVQFVQLTGATDKELRAIMDKKIRVDELYHLLGSNWTDYNRESKL